MHAVARWFNAAMARLTRPSAPPRTGSGRFAVATIAVTAGAVGLVGGGAVALALDDEGDDGARSGAPPTTTTERAAPRRTTATSAAEAPAPAPPASNAAASSAGRQDLAGRTVVLDPGHNGRNGAHPATIDRPVGIGNGRKACNTTGTQSRSGLTESRFNWLVTQHVRRALEARGAAVELTRDDDRGVGPCIDRRARIANRAGADAAVSIHADGAPSGRRGFHVILPGRVPQVAGHDAIVVSSGRLGRRVRNAFRTGSGLPYSDYLGREGLDVRTDLGGLNLLTVPGVMIETGNMQNATDAGRMADGAWRRRAGRAIATGIGRFLLDGR